MASSGCIVGKHIQKEVDEIKQEQKQAEERFNKKLDLIPELKGAIESLTNVISSSLVEALNLKSNVIKLEQHSLSYNSRLEKLENKSSTKWEKINDIEKKIAYWSGGMAVAGAIGGFVLSKIF